MTPGQFKSQVKEVKQKVETMLRSLKTDPELTAYVYGNCPGSFERFEDIKDVVETFQENF